MGTERSMRNPHLYGIGTDHRNEVAVVRPPTFTVGRSPDCSLVIPNYAVSRLHCIFKFDETTWTLTDLSLGGTYINGKKVPKGVVISLDEGSVVKLGPQPNFIYIFSFRDREDLEPVLSRLALRMQGDEECKIIGTVSATPSTSTSQESNVPNERLWNERQYHIPQNVPHINNNVNEMFQETLVCPSNTIGSSSPSGMSNTTRVHTRFHNPSSNKRIHELSVIYNSSFKHGIQPSGSYGPSSPSGECNSKKMRHSFQDSGLGPYELTGVDGFRYNQGNMQTSGPSGLHSSHTFSSSTMCHSFASPSGPSGQVMDSIYSSDQMSDSTDVGFTSRNTVIETNFKNQVMELKRKLLDSQAKESYLMSVNQELQNQLEESRMTYERKLQNVGKSEQKIGQPNSQDSPSVGHAHWDSNYRPKSNKLLSETQGFTPGKNMVNVITNVKYVQKPRNSILELDLVKGELNRMQLEHVDMEKVLTETKKLKNSLLIQLQNSNETLKELKKELTEANEAKDSLNLCLKNYEEKLQNLYSLVENDLQCSICNEIFVTPITLKCRHTFCEFCIIEWKKKKRDCPMCRSPIVTESRSLPIENFIDKITETKDDIKDHRMEVIRQRKLASAGRNLKREEESEIQEIPHTDESSNGDETPPVINYPTEVVSVSDFSGAEIVYLDFPWL